MEKSNKNESTEVPVGNHRHPYKESSLWGRGTQANLGWLLKEVDEGKWKL